MAKDEMLLDEEFLRKLEGLVLLARQLARSQRRADRRSSVQGTSVEFADHRPFVSGDDWRYIDWNAFARLRTLVLKRFEETRDLPLYLVLDGTLSMNFGEPNKFAFARRIVAGLAYLALANHDRVGAVLLSPDGVREEPPTRGRDQIQKMFRTLSGWQVDEGMPSLRDMVQRWLVRRPARGMVILVTDLFGTDWKDALEAIDRLRYSRHEVGVVQIFAPQEAKPGNLGEWELKDQESGAVRSVILDTKLQKDYADLFQQYGEEIERYARRYSIPLVRTDTRTPEIEFLTKILGEKGFLA